MYVCMYVCMYVYMCVCVCVCVRMCTLQNLARALPLWFQLQLYSATRDPYVACFLARVPTRFLPSASFAWSFQIFILLLCKIYISKER